MSSRPLPPTPGPPIPRWVRWARHLPAWVGLLMAFGVVVVLTSRPAAPGTRDLSGTWPADVVLADGRTHTTQVELPGLFVLSGIPGDARVLAVTEIAGSAEPQALFVDRPQYAITATWDGTPFASVGDPSREGRDARSSAPLFAILPPSAPGTRHELGLEIRGDYGKGGVLGRVLVGPVGQIHEAARATEVQRLAFALGLSLLASLPLVVAARGAWRPAYTMFGLFTSTLAIHSITQSSLAESLLGDALLATRVLRVAGPLISAFGVSYLAVLITGGLRTFDKGLVGSGGALALLGVVAPPGWLYRLEIAGELLFILSAATYVQLVYRALRDRITGSWLLAGAVVPVVWSLASEMTLTHGLRTGGSNILVAGLLFAVALGAALVLRDAETSEQHARLVRGSLDAMVTVDPEGRVRDANLAAERQLLDGGPQFLQIVAEEDRPLVRAHLTRAQQRADRTEFRTVKNRVFESLATPMAPGMLNLTLRDITIRRELDRGLLQAARVETVALLLGGVAHDFNNMLSTLLAHLGLLRARLADPWGRDRIERMEMAVDRASELTRRLLTVARGTGSELVTTDLSQVCGGAVLLVEPTLPPGVRLVSDLPVGLPPVLGAGGDLEQVVVNLLVNARDAVGEQGSLRIAARAYKLGKQGRGVALMVEDDGPGIPDERKEEVFHPFVTTKRRGTGLGLAVARQILRDHHGRIWVEDRPGGGARFVVALRHADAVDEAPAPLPRGRRIVLVEDEHVLLEDYERSLVDAGYLVRAFTSAPEAARYLADNELDLLVTDVAMPEMNGFELARRSLSHHREVPILFVSAFIPHESLRDLPEDSWQALHKPVRSARLVATVGRIRRRVERRARGDDEITRVNYMFPDLADLTSHALGFDEPRGEPTPVPIARSG